jgi:drug/metabolite transporter (DMT)-like permease
MRQRFVKHWWLWLLIAVLAVIGNELVDRAYSQSHPAGDLLVAIAAVAVAFFGTELVISRRRARRTTSST